ncbi:homeotic protein spalt-major-like protein [Turdus rufiventris]|nr:homeotic protein spalt-major-like protein [Turdus rufiventris]
MLMLLCQPSVLHLCWEDHGSISTPVQVATGVCLAGHRPFQCRYCPYSASQKGNLKTHVLCVHRMPFDNSQYPDRRFKRSRVDSEAAGNSEEPAAAKAGSSAELAEESAKAQE